jgi:hypothetical protein
MQVRYQAAPRPDRGWKFSDKKPGPIPGRDASGAAA